MKKLILIILGVGLAAFLVFVFKINQFYRKIYTPKNHLAKIKESYTILLFGFAGGRHEGTYLTDTIILAHPNIKNKTVTLFSIPRDLWVQIPTQSGDAFRSKINTVYQMELNPGDYPDLDKKYLGNRSDAALIKSVVSQTFGLPVDNYIALDFEGFKKAIDVLGGVDINVEKSFEDKQYPLEGKEKDLCGRREEELPQLEKIASSEPEVAFPCRFETLVFKKGEVHMDGELALKYVRSRHSKEDGGDFGRARRQQLLLEAVRRKVLSLGFLPKVIPFLDQLGGHVKTDISFTEMKKFTAEAGWANQYRLETFVFTDKNYLKETVSEDGQYILIPKIGEDRWGEIQKAVQLLIK
jgi:anionic cell wall polymer biosynthesis LytR-Cps2A-Psr (LCP) family protein